MDKQNFYEVFIEKFVLAANDREDLKAAFVIGSRARKKHPADEWSDLDILLYTEDPGYYLEQAEFIQQFGKIWSSFSTMTLGNDPERLTLFEGGYQVDLVVKTEKEYQKQLASGQVPWLFKRGVQLLVDKTGEAEKLLPEKEFLPEKMPLTEEHLYQCDQMFWFMTLYISKQLMRKELWAVKAREMDYKNILLQVIEWYELSLHGADYDTWHGGKFIHLWAEQEVYQALFEVFGGFDLESSWQALEKTTALFAKLTSLIKEQQHYTLSLELGDKVMSWIKENK